MTAGFGFCRACGTALAEAGQGTCRSCGAFLAVPLRGRNRLNPILLVVGTAIVAVIVGASTYTLGHGTAGQAQSSGVSGSQTAAPLFPGSLAIEPATYSCSADILVRLTIQLPASVQGSRLISFRGNPGGLFPLIENQRQVGQALTKKGDGSWFAIHGSSSTDLCAVPGEFLGRHSLELVDADGNLMGSVSWTAER